MAKRSTLTYSELIKLLKKKFPIYHYRTRKGGDGGYYIDKQYIYANYFWNLKNQNAIIVKKIDEQQTEMWVVAKNIDITTIELKPIMVKCLMCPNIFEKKGTKVTCSKNCQRRYHNQTMKKYYTPSTEKSREETQKRTKKKRKKGKKPSILLSTGCIVIQYKITHGNDNGRCDKYALCKHNRKCLYELPEYWQGFKCINNHIGFEYKNPEKEGDII